MKKIIKFTILFFLLFYPNIPAISKGNIEFEILDEKTVDVPLKTEIVQQILIKGDLSKETITRFIWERYDLLKNRRGFKFHSSPTNMGVYLYISKEHYNSGWGQWIAMIYNRVDEGNPKVIYSMVFQGQIESLSANPETISGLSEEKRKKIWEESIHAEDRSWAEAEKAMPNSKSMEDLKLTYELRDKLNEKYNAEIIKKYNIDKGILKKIELEGLKKDWPMSQEKY